jgi:hypothetical protein
MSRSTIAGELCPSLQRPREAIVFLFRYRRCASMLQRGDVIADGNQHLVVLAVEEHGDVIRTRLEGDGEIIFDWPRDFAMSVYRERDGRPGAIDERTGRRRCYALYGWSPSAAAPVVRNRRR